MTVIINGTDNAVGNPAFQGSTGGTSAGLYYPAANTVAITTSGVNALTISSTQAATFAGNVTITGTSAHTGNASFSNITATGTLATASQGIAFASLPTGSVLQVVNAVYTTGVSTTSGTLSDTGLTATITPKFSTSKILVLVNQNGGVKTTGTNNSIQLYLLRNSTAIAAISERAGLTTNSIDMYLETLSISFLDSPATTSAVTYKTQYATFAPPNLIYLQLVGCASTITLMEIAA